MMTIGQKIKKARKEAGLTQKELAEKAGTATGTIQQYELGKRQPRLKQLESLANALGVSVAYFTTPFLGTFDSARVDFKLYEKEQKIDKAINMLLEAMYGNREVRTVIEKGFEATLTVYGEGEEAFSLEGKGLYIIGQAIQGVVVSLVQSLRVDVQSAEKELILLLSSDEAQKMREEIDKKRQKHITRN